MSKDKVHTRYKLKDGTPIPGVTTITGLLNKPALLYWAWNLGCKGIDYRKFTDDKAMIGTLAHEMILAHLSKRNVDTSDYSKNQIDLAENAFLSYLEWEKGHKVEPIMTETQLVSERYMYGGTLDFLGTIDGTLELVDFKTGSGIFDEMWFQIAAYGVLSLRHPAKYRILNIPRTEDEAFKEEVKVDLSLHFEAFLKLLDFYYLNKRIKGSKP